jgi:hypothetical protein
LDHLHSKATDLFSSTEEALEFVEDYDLDVAKATLLQQAKRHAEAAEVHIAEGRILDGIRIFLENLADEDCARRATICVLQALWQKLSFAVLPTAAQSTNVVEHWLKLASRLDPTLMTQHDRDEVRTSYVYANTLVDFDIIVFHVPGNHLS